MLIAEVTLSIFIMLGTTENPPTQYPMQYQRENLTKRSCEEFAASINEARGLIYSPEGEPKGMAVGFVARCIPTEESLM